MKLTKIPTHLFDKFRLMVQFIFAIQGFSVHSTRCGAETLLVSGGRGSLGLSPILLLLALFTLTASPLILARILITPTFPAGSLFLVFSFQKSFLMGKNGKQFYKGKEMTISNYLCTFTYIFTLFIGRKSYIRSNDKKTNLHGKATI